MHSFFSPAGIALFAATSFLCSCTGSSVLSSDEDPVPNAPVINLALNRTRPSNDGLLPAAGPHGWPITDGDSMDPAIVESRRFYDVLAQLSFTSAQEAMEGPRTEPWATGATSPMTLDEWKRTFQFPPRQAGESMEAYRMRAGIVIYYNRNELGLGRELGCAQFPAGTDKQGNTLTGIACYVTNYGYAFRDVRNSLQLAEDGGHAKNTVCIAYLPNMDPGYQVQFFVYGPAGRRQDWAQLDTIGPRANPHVCMNCHGGVYDDQRHLAKYARFLPLDPNVVSFADPGEAPAITRAAQEERIRRLNALSLRTPLTGGQRQMLQELYQGGVETPGTISQNSWAPPGWRDTSEHRELFDQVVKPYCFTCHLAMEQGLDGSRLHSYDIFESADRFRSFPSNVAVCGDFSMPNAQTTLVNFWNTDLGPIMVGGKAYHAPADALLGFYGRDRSTCARIGEVSTCNRGPDPDLNCGNADSGAACNRLTGRCLPQRGLGILSEGQGPVGYCRMDGSRRCTYPMQCQPAKERLPGLETFDGVCMPCGGPGAPACN
jgi:hypothetical protein